MRAICFILLVVGTPTIVKAEESVEQLLSQLDTAKPDVRAELAKRADKSVLGLVAIATDKKESYGRRFAACLTLGEIGNPRTIEASRSLLQVEGMRGASLYGLDAAGPAAKAAADDVAKILKAPENEHFSGEIAVGVLEKAGSSSPAVLDALTSCIGQGRSGQRGAADKAHHAALILSKLGEPGADTLVSLAAQYLAEKEHPAGKDYSEAYSVISGRQLPAAIIPALLKHMSDGKKGYVAALGLGCVGPPAKPHLIKLLDDKKPEVCFNAAEALAHMNFRARWENGHNGERFEGEPVAAKEVFPKLLKIGALKDGHIDRRIVGAMLVIDHDKAMNEPIVFKTMQDDLIEAIKLDARRPPK